MACDRYRRLLPALSDRELGPLQRFLVARHATRCAACSTELDGLETMRTALRARLTYHRAPPSLAARIGSVLPREAPPAEVPPRRWPLPAWAVAGSGLVGALAGAALTVVVLGGHPSSADRALQGVIDSQIRARMADHLTDIPSSDQHSVKPWLSARLPVSPPVPELKDVGFPLVGGREDFIDGRPTAVVVYRHGKHVVNLYAWAATAPTDTAFRTTRRQGFNIVSWRQSGIAYHAVSDCAADALMRFVREIERAATGS